MITEEQLAKIRLLALDVDGVLTDGSIIIGQEGELSKHFDARDGMGISLALRHGIQVLSLPAATVKSSCTGPWNWASAPCTKMWFLRERSWRRLQRTGYSPGRNRFHGGRSQRSAGLFQAAVTLAPADAAPEVRERAMLVSSCTGGHGAVRDVIERILKAKGLWEEIIRSYEIQGQGDRQ